MKAGATPSDAKAVWDSLAKPSCRKVAAKLTAAGLSVSYKTVNKWRDAGWVSKTAEQIEASASNAVEKINVALPALTGDVTSKIEDVASSAPETPATEAVPAQTVTAPAQAAGGTPEAAKPDTRTNIERAEDALLTAITGATSVWDSIRDLMAGVDLPKGRVLPPMLLAAQPEGIATLMSAASQAISQAIEDSKQIPFLRAEAAASIPGTQTVYAPGEGPHAAADHPLRSAMEVYDAALKGIRERKT